MESGLMGRRLDMVFGGVFKVILILDSGLGIRQRGMVSIFGLMEIGTRESG